MSLKPIERTESLTARVYAAIEDMVVSGSLEPGARLNEVLLAEQLAVSRGPVREATRALVKAGLLVSIPARGVFVRKMSDREVSENYDVRALLTGLMCARAAQLRTEADVGRLARLVGDMERAITEDRIADYYEINLEFHDLIGRIAGHGCAHRVYDDLIRETHSLRRALSSPGQTNSEHRGMVEAIRAGDADLARRRGEEHVLHGKERWQAALRAAGITPPEL
ncbi:GntR family transcriptional regulator [Methylobrevis albus]|uniref:FCD domain-containing protein n=1 Tax=Methylobrevis albus TaxID=2793297 RepID=A0A931I492_9HYPH|nr:GntR family transcriptional regulator [Methylobrevis albus]MBH0239607.1 FCD domain-containing protein [Methylobrevis albus]